MYKEYLNREVYVMKEIYVVGAIIKSQSKVLCAQRSDKMSLPGLWEFPGGKIEGEETHQEALKREINEELKMDIRASDQLFKKVTYDYDFGRVHLSAYRCELIKGTPILTEHQTVKWLEIDDLDKLSWAPADIPIVDKLKKEGI